MLSRFTAALVFLASAVAAGVFLPVILQPMVVMSGSMEPAIPVHSLILVRPAPGEEFASGDVIVFKLPGKEYYVTHRVVGILDTEPEKKYITRGDANSRVDRDPVPAASILGRVVAVIPLLGKGILLLKRAPWYAVTAASGAAAALLIWIYCYKRPGEPVPPPHKTSP